MKKRDCRKIWSNRTSIYDVKNMKKNGIIKPKTGVPKTAALVACGGCGLKTFYGADGLTVHKGNHANMDSGHSVFYCNDVCAAVDWEINRENSNVQNKGFRPLRKANYWVQSKASTKARKMLRRAVEQGELPDLDAIMHEIRVQRQVGGAQSAAIAKKLPGNDEEDKQAGMTGTQKAKRHIIRGAAHLVDFDKYPEPDVWFGKEPPKGTTKEQIAREKRERFNADTAEIKRIQRDGSVVGGKGTIDKNAPSKPVEEKRPKPSKWKGVSKVSLAAEPNSGAGFEDAREMYKVRQSEKRSDELPTSVLGTRAAGAPTFVQDAPPPSSRQSLAYLIPTLFAIRFAHRSLRRSSSGRGTQRRREPRRQGPRSPTGDERPRNNSSSRQSTIPTTNRRGRGRESSTSGGSTTSRSQRGGSNSWRIRRASTGSNTTLPRTGETTKAWYQNQGRAWWTQRTTQHYSGKAWKTSSCQGKTNLKRCVPKNVFRWGGGGMEGR